MLIKYYDLPGQSTLEMTFESAQFDADLFALASNQTFSKGAVKVVETYEVTVAVDNTAKLETSYAARVTPEQGEDPDPNAPVFSINGMTEAAEAAEGKYAVADSTGGEQGAAYTTVFTFAAADSLAGKAIEIYVERNVDEIDNIIVDNQQTFVGECILRWPKHIWALRAKAHKQTLLNGETAMLTLHNLPC